MNFNINDPLIINHTDYDLKLITLIFKLNKRIDAMPGIELLLASNPENSDLENHLKATNPYPVEVREDDDYLIVSEGTGIGSKVYWRGVELTRVTEVEILPFKAGDFVKAKITVAMPRLHIRANVDFSDHKREGKNQHDI